MNAYTQYNKVIKGSACMNIAIVDDNERDRLHLEQILKQYAVMNRLSVETGHFQSGEEFIKTYQPFQYTAVFLDIFMNGMSGISTAEKIRETDEDTAIVFLTTSEAFRSEAFSVFASAYLTKPTQNEEVFRFMDHILRLRTETDSRFCFAYDRHEYSLSFAEIVSVETDRNYLLIKDTQGRRYRTRMTFSSVQEQMDSRFLILIKGILVNMDCVEQIKDKQCIMKNGDIFPIHVKKERDIKQKWLNYKFASIRKASAV